MAAPPFAWNFMIPRIAGVRSAEQSGIIGENILCPQHHHCKYNIKSGKGENVMTHKVKITVLRRELFPDLQEQYLANPKAGKCEFFQEGQEFLVGSEEYMSMLNGKFCAEAWDCVSRYIYSALQGGSIMGGWTNDEKMMIACCNDGTRPVIFKLERVDIEEA